MEQTIESYEDFQRCVPGLFRIINGDPDLSIRAAVNPLLAVEEVGWRMAPAVRKKIERFARFSPRERRQLAAIEGRLRAAAGEDLDFDDPEQLEWLLFQKFGLERPAGMTSLAYPGEAASGASGDAARKIWTDPLDTLKKNHPIMEPLLAYRKLQVQHPTFATRSQYEEVRNRQRILPISRLRIFFSSPGTSVETLNA